MALTVVHAALVIIAFVSLYLAVYPALIKFSPQGLAKLAVPYRLGKELEFWLYTITFFVLLPLGTWTASRQARRFEAKGIDPSFLAVLDLVAVSLTVIVARLVLSQAPPVVDPARKHWVQPVSAGVFVVMVGLIAANLLVSRRPGSVPRVSFGDRTTAVLVAVSACSALAFVPGSAFRDGRGLAGLALAVALYVGWRASRRVSVSRRVGLGIDVLALVVLGLLIWNVALPSASQFQTLAYNENFYLGPVNSVLHGAGVLVDLNPHYGPVLTYFLAGVFQLAPVGYGTFFLVSAVFDVILFLTMYGVLRLAGVSRLLAVTGVVSVALIAAFSKEAVRAVMDPSRSMRLSIPMLAVLGVQLMDRYPSRRVTFSWLLAALVGLSSIWAMEVFVYTLAGVLAGLACLARLDAPAGRRLKIDWGIVWRLASGVVVAQVVFAACTRLFYGSWPDWVRYLEWDRAYSVGSSSQRYHWAAFGPGVMLGLFYFTATVATIVVLVWNRPFAEGRRRMFLAICAVEGLAVAFFSYFAGVSELASINKMMPVAILLVVLLVSVLEDGRSPVSVPLRVGLVVLSVACAATYLIAKPQWVHTAARSALLASPRATIRDVKNEAGLPVAYPLAPAAAALLDRTVSSDRALVLMPDFQTTEVLMRAHKRQLLPISDPFADRQLPGQTAHFRGLAGNLPPGTRFLSLADYFDNADGAAQSGELDGSLIQELKRRYVIRVDAVGPEGLRVYRLVSRR